MCAAGTTPQRKSSETEGRFAALGITVFNGDPVVSVVIVMGKHNKAEVESEIDVFAELIRGENYADCSEKITS